MAATTMLPVSNSNHYYVCSVTITNTGSTTQEMKANSFSAIRWYDTGAHYRSVSTATPTNVSWYRMSSAGHSFSSAADTPCSTASSLPTGAACVIRWNSEPIPNTEQWALCAGSFTIQDSTATTPGVVTASGAIFLQQETMVMGGVLSGAHYLSGAPIWDHTGVQLSSTMDQDYQLGAGPGKFMAGTMNLYCSSACGRFQSAFDATTAGRCNEICGVGALGPTYNAPTGFPLPMSTIGWLNTSAPYQFSKTPDAKVSDAGGFSIPQPLVPGTTAYGNPMLSLSVANGIFAGGMVTEVTMGPLSSICSGNAEYWAAGEIDFTFPSFVTSSTVVEGNGSYAGAPPQRLLCSQRHGREDLFLRTGSSVGFPINGGLPF